MTEKASKQERKEKVIEVLNKARAMELYAISQYMNQHYALDDMDYGELAKNIKLIAIDEMRHAEDFAERIKELGGEPTTDFSDKVQKDQAVDTIFSFNTELEDNTIDTYNEFYQVCRDNGDTLTSKLFERIIDEEQEHENYFDNTAGHISNLGQVYLSKIAGTSASTGASSKGFISSSDEGE